MTGEADAGFEDLLGFLQQSRGFDFGGYKRPSLMRRVSRRLQMLGIGGFEDYKDYLEVHPAEFALLFNTILINVTSFFRDPDTWDYLAREVVPPMLGRKTPGSVVRVWSAGCAAGQEAYTIAMMLAESLGWEAFRERVKIYATDVDEEALAQARQGSYSVKEVEMLSPERLERYFDLVSGRYVFRGDLRRAVIFGRNDLMEDAPISRLDLLSCRNTLMYFNAEAQAKILGRFHFALNGDGKGNGALVLGRAEMLLTHNALFTPLDLKFRVFAKVPPAYRRAAPLPEVDNASDMSENPRLRDQALEESPVARIAVDANGLLAIANARARVLFSINAKDLGRPLKDLEISYRPAELRALIEQAHAERRTVTLTSVERRFADGEMQFLDVVVTPLFADGHKPLGAAISFIDVTRATRLQEELRRSHEEVQTASEELQSSNEELQTTNEELQSSNEELETTNEELQSTNEELETMNEELQSTNEELQTVNEELRTRSEELNHVNAFLGSVLGSLSAGAVVVNSNLDVIMWNYRAEDLWGLRAEEVQGKGLLNLDIGLPVAELRTVIRPCLAGEIDRQEVLLDAVNRRGKKIKCRVTCTPLVAGSRKREGVILMMEEI
ncbi:MAG TPA: CheR family methyltransferase [Burkholderiales bacterium]|nr:CheR family methyltransferase [Burkholderiales bacterium]